MPKAIRYVQKTIYCMNKLKQGVMVVHQVECVPLRPSPYHSHRGLIPACGPSPFHTFLSYSLYNK